MLELKIPDLAKRIDAHLKRLEADTAANRTANGRARFFTPSCRANGRFVAVTYVSYQSSSNMTKAEAAAYLAKLDAGYMGRHFEALRETPSPSEA